MKIQCSCGLKYSFDVTPEMAQSPVNFVCKNCGADNSALTNELIRRELGLPASASTSPALADGVPALAPPSTSEHVTVRMKGAGSPLAVRATSAPAPSASPAPPLPPPPKPAGALRVSVHKPAASEVAPKEEAPQLCPKHPGQLATQRCAVCGKAICPKCMELFGFVCSALCKGKAEAQGKHVPVYAGQKSAVQSRVWRRVGLLVIIGSVLAIGAGGAWIWYTYSGSIPKGFLLVRFPDPAYSGQMRFASPNQIVVLHGGTLARHDLKLKKEIWSKVLLDKKKIAEESNAQFEKSKNARPSDLEGSRPLTLEELIEQNESLAARELHLYVQGENVWVSYPNKVVRYDWESGSAGKEISFEGAPLRVAPHGDELLLIPASESQPKITHVELASGNSRIEQLGAPPSLAKAPSSGAPAKASGAPVASRLAAPAVRAAKANQQRALAEMKQPKEAGSPSANTPASLPSMPLLPAANGFLQVTFKRLGSTTAGTANPRFQVTLRRLGGAGTSEWTGETPGEPQLFPLKTVDVLVCERAFWLFGKNLNVLWQGQLNHDLVGQQRNLLANQIPAWGEGPLVERGDTLYLFDSGELSAFELSNGKARWRFPAELVAGMFFDDRGMIYLNACRQYRDILATTDHVNIPEDTVEYIQKIDSITGKPLWRLEKEGFVRYVSGKFIYTVASQQGDPGEDEDIDSMPVINTGFQKIPHVRIKRLDPGNGRVLWEHYHRHTPLDVQFDKNTISVLCKKEMRALKFFAF